MSDLYENAFNDGFTWNDAEKNVYKLHPVTIGKLKLTSGQVVACDPFFYTGDKPFDTVFPKGEFPVELAVADLKGDERVAFARVNFSGKKPVRWAIAVTEDQDASTLTKDQIFGYGVDAGTGCFMEPSAAEKLSTFIDADDKNYQKVIDDMQATYKNTRSWLIWEQDGVNAALFSSGWGDGFYATYIGYDRDDTICRLVTDFGMME